MAFDDIVVTAEAGDTFVMYILGTVQSRVTDWPPIFVQAHKWLTLAGARDDLMKAFAAPPLGAVAAKMTPEQITEAQRLAQAWLAAHPE